MKQNYVLCASEEGFHRVAYTEWGEASPRAHAVICVHGLMRNSRDFDALAHYLSGHGHHVFCPDIVGRGESSWLKNSQEYNFKRYIIDMNILLSRTGATHFDWIGTSMGGLIGIMMASLPNTPIRRLVLNDVGPQVPIYSLWQIAKNLSNHSHFKSKAEAKAYYKKIYAEFGPLSETQWDTFTEHSVKESSPGRFVSKFDPAIHEFKFTWQSVKDMLYNPHKALEGIFFDVDLWQMWQNIKCPVLVIRGERSTLLLPEHLKKMQQIHPDTTVYEIAEAGHAPALLEREHHKTINAWLGSQEDDVSP